MHQPQLAHFLFFLNSRCCLTSKPSVFYFSHTLSLLAWCSHTGMLLGNGVFSFQRQPCSCSWFFSCEKSEGRPIPPSRWRTTSLILASSTIPTFSLFPTLCPVNYLLLIPLRQPKRHFSRSNPGSQPSLRGPHNFSAVPGVFSPTPSLLVPKPFSEQ